MHGGLKIGEVARQAGVTAKAIRFYERTGLLGPAPRAKNGYRLYMKETIDVLAFVKQASGLGLSLAEIREIIAIRRGGRPPCAHVHHLLAEKAVELDRKLRDLLEVRRRIRRSLAAWRRAPSGRAAVCPHIEAGDVVARGLVITTRERRRSHAADRSPRGRHELPRV